MKPLLILAASLVLTAACSREPKKPRVDGHGDGEIHLPIAFRVVDAQSGAPIPDASVTFYDKVDLAILALIDVTQRTGRTPKDKVPTGVIARTSNDGSTTITCRFDAAFLWSFEGGDRKDIGTDVFPSGRFVIRKQGYRALDRTAREVFSKPPYSADQLKLPSTLQLEKEPNQALEPTITTVTSPAAQEPRRP